MRFLTTIAALTLATASSALAADLPVKAPAPVMAPVCTWCGFYIGVNGGYSWGHSSRDLNFFSATGATITATGGGRNMDGGLFGGQIGYNWQMSSWVFGIEADAQWTGQKGDTTFFPGVLTALPAGTVANLEDKLDWFGTIRGRVGYTVTPNVLFYITGGGAWGEVDTTVGVAAPTFFGVTGTRTTDRFGWTFGGGIEGMFARNWSAKLEYLYMDIGSVSNTVAVPGTLIGANVSSRVTDNIFRGGINYHFSAGMY